MEFELETSYMPIQNEISDKEGFCCGAELEFIDWENRSFWEHTGKTIDVLSVIFDQYKCRRCDLMKVKCNMCNGFIDAQMVEHEKSVFPAYHLKECMGRGGTSIMRDELPIADGEFAEIKSEIYSTGIDKLLFARNHSIYVRNASIMDIHPHIAIISVVGNIANIAKYKELCVFVSDDGCLCISCGCAFDCLPPYELALSHIKKCVKKTSVRYSYE